MEPLYELGAEDVIPEDYEASVEVLVRVLAKYLVPRSNIERLVTQSRTEHHEIAGRFGPGKRTEPYFSLHFYLLHTFPEDVFRQHSFSAIYSVGFRSGLDEKSQFVVRDRIVNAR